MNILLQPCANDDAQRHFKDTIQSPVRMSVLRRYLPTSVVRYLTEFAGDGAIMVWGMTPGTDHSTITSWSRLGNGDLAAFYASKRVFFVGRICATAQDARLSRHLWGEQDDGQTWELLYFLHEGSGADLPLHSLTSALGYASDAVLRARVCDITPEAEALLIRSLGPPPEVQDAVAAVEERASGRGRRQRYAVSPETRKAIEDYATMRAIQYFRQLGWTSVEDVSATKPFDLVCSNGSDELRVEVKGTTSDGSEILLTPNEVRHARTNRPRVALYVQCEVEVIQRGQHIVARGGRQKVCNPWNVDSGTLTPVGYSYRLP